MGTARERGARRGVFLVPEGGLLRQLLGYGRVPFACDLRGTAGSRCGECHCECPHGVPAPLRGAPMSELNGESRPAPRRRSLWAGDYLHYYDCRVLVTGECTCGRGGPAPAA